MHRRGLEDRGRCRGDSAEPPSSSQRRDERVVDAGEVELAADCGQLVRVVAPTATLRNVAPSVVRPTQSQDHDRSPAARAPALGRRAGAEADGAGGCGCPAKTAIRRRR